MKRTGPVLVGLASVLAVAVGCSSWNSQTTAPNPGPNAPVALGKPAPDITGEDIEGTSFKLSDYRGKVVMLDFWGNW